MKKTLVINMDDLNFTGDVLDVCTDKNNIISNSSNSDKCIKICRFVYRTFP